VLWTRWGRDWEAQATPLSIVARIGQPEAGDILLLHDSDRYAAPGSWRNTLGALPFILERISSLGLRARPVGELLEIPVGELGRHDPRVLEDEGV
jgi:peptidoglycan-N-acetylglucosamine deacetylase